jgi:hypothetical protein
MLHFDGCESRLDRALMAQEHFDRLDNHNPPPPVRTCLEMAEADPDGMRPYFAELPAAQLAAHCLHLYYDAARLRRELDDAQGVIR